MFIKDLNKLTKEDLIGKIICFPTDTVYGVGCILGDFQALEKIYELKNRDLSKPLAILVPNSLSITPYIKECPNIAKTYMDKHWPGALTIIFNKKEPNIGYMFQKDNLLEWRTVLGNVYLGLELQKRKTKERKETKIKKKYFNEFN